MADQTIRFFEFAQNTLKEDFSLVGYRETDRKEIRTSFNDLLFSLGLIDYSQEDIQNWLMAGFSWLDIGVFLLQKQNLKRDIAEPFIFARVPSEEIDTLIDYLKTAEGFQKTGIAFCDGSPFVDNSGSSWDLQNRFIRSYGRSLKENGEKLVCYQTQEDAMQKIEGSFGTAGGWNLPNELFQTGPFKFRSTGGFSTYNGGGIENPKFAFDFDSSLVVRTASENRSKNIYFPYFQVVKKLDFRTLGTSPSFLN